MPRAEEYVLASFNSLKLLHNAECDSLIKFAYKLSYKALNPSTFERQNVKLALQIFSKFTAEALSILGEKLKIPQYGNTNVFIEIILTCWQIVNVKKPWKGLKFKEQFWRTPDSRWELGIETIFAVFFELGRNLETQLTWWNIDKRNIYSIMPHNSRSCWNFWSLYWRAWSEVCSVWKIPDILFRSKIWTIFAAFRRKLWCIIASNIWMWKKDSFVVIVSSEFRIQCLRS